MLKFRKFYLSEMATREISVSEFPNPLRGRIKNIFQKKGEMDGSDADDKVKTKFRGWGANQLETLTICNLSRQITRHGCGWCQGWQLRIYGFW